MDPLALEFGIQVNYASTQEHVPEAKRNNRVIKERIHATYHRLPYDRLPRIMVKVLVDDSAKKLNFFPAKNGISQYYSPRMICISEILTMTSIVSMLLELTSKPTMSPIHIIPMPLAPWIAFIFDTMTTSKEAIIYCICKQTV
jgi:hypothetical protein